MSDFTPYFGEFVTFTVRAIGDRPYKTTFFDTLFSKGFIGGD